MKKYPITRVCETLEISRSNQYQNPKTRPRRYRRKEDDLVIEQIRSVAKDKSTYGYRRTAGILRRLRKSEGLRPYNAKRIYRLMAMHGLLLSRPLTRPERMHDGQIITMRSDMRYCSDILEIHCWNGQEVHVAFSLDCHDREAIAFVARPFDLSHEDILVLMDKTAVSRFGPSVDYLPSPIQWLSDNGPQYTAKETTLYGKEWGFVIRTTPAYSPESNGMSEAFVGTFKRDYVYTHELPSAATVIEQLPTWFEDYNKNAPHSGLKYMSPWEYRAQQKKNEAIIDNMNNDPSLGQPKAWGVLNEKLDIRENPGLS